MSEGRYIPADIRKYLRAEVGYGCPIPGCRSPFLEYHHFDPRYSDLKKHIKEGMIALCPTHHAQADINTWTKQELYSFKKMEAREPVRGRINWSLKNGVIVLGNNYHFEDSFHLDIVKKEVFSLRQKNDGSISINAVLYDSDMHVIAKIDDYDIVINKLEVGDLNCSASGNNIRIESIANKTYFNIDFQRLEYIKFVKMLQGLKDEVKGYILYNIKDRIIDEKILVLSFQANISTKLFLLNVRHDSVDFDFTKMGFIKGSIKDGALQGGYNINNYLSFGR